MVQGLAIHQARVAESREGRSMMICTRTGLAPYSLSQAAGVQGIAHLVPVGQLMAVWEAWEFAEFSRDTLISL